MTMTVGAPAAHAAPTQTSTSPGATLSADPIGRYIVVLGAQIGTFGNPPAILEQRLDRAAALARSHPFNRVIVSGGNTWWLPISEASFMQAGLIKRGVPMWQILGEHRSTSTVQNARYVVGMLKSLHATGAVVVTNTFHMKRAMKNFREEAKEQNTALALAAAYV